MSDKTELDALVKLTEEFVTATWHLLDNSETSGPKDDPTITVWQPNFDEVSALLDRCEGLPSGSMEHIAAGELLAANLISAITTLRAQLAVAEACNRGLVRLNEATQDRAGAAEAERAAQDWQPIETAPKDYTHVIGIDAKGCVARTWFFAPSSLTQDWLRVGLPGKAVWNPTHWKPLHDPAAQPHDRATLAEIKGESHE